MSGPVRFGRGLARLSVRRTAAAGPRPRPGAEVARRGARPGVPAGLFGAPAGERLARRGLNAESRPQGQCGGRRAEQYGTVLERHGSPFDRRSW